MSRQSKTPTKSGRRVKLTRIGHAVMVKPVCPDVLGRLQGVEHVMVNDRQHGSRLEVAPRRIYSVHTALDGTSGTSTGDAQVGITTAGLEPVVRHLLREKRYRAQSTAPAESLSSPDLGAIRAHGAVDDGLLDLVRHYDRGIVRYGPKADIAWLIGQIALAHPNLTVMVATARVDEAKSIARALRRWISNDVTLVRAGAIPANPKRIMVATYQAMLGGCTDIAQRGLFVAVDAVEALGEHGLTALNAAGSARLLGLLDDDRQMAPRDTDHIRSYFGFEELHIPAHGHHLLPVDVVFDRIVGGAAIPSGADPVTIHRSGIWRNPVRNRRIARLAQALHGNDQQALQRFQRVSQAIGRREVRRVAVLVANVEHGLQIARKLPGWPLITGPDITGRDYPEMTRNCSDRCAGLRVWPITASIP